MEKGTEKNEGLHGTACIELQEGPEEKDGFKQSREQWKKAEQEYKSIGLENAEEVIDAIMKAKEAAEKAAAHMDNMVLEGESVARLVQKQVKPESIRDFLRLMSLAGMEEDQKRKRKEARKSPYKEFIQMNCDEIGHLIGLVDHPQAFKLLLFIMENMDGYNKLACSYTVMEERFGISHATVWRSIKYLKDHGYIYIYKSGSCNIYTLSPELAWRSWRSNIQYCKFPANVMISGSEQTSRTRMKKKRGSVELAKPKEEIVKEECPFG